MKSAVEELIGKSWFLKSSNEKEQKCVLSCDDLDVRLEYNEMFDEFVPVDVDDVPMIRALTETEEWWDRVEPILCGETERV